MSIAISGVYTYQDYSKLGNEIFEIIDGERKDMTTAPSPYFSQAKKIS